MDWGDGMIEFEQWFKSLNANGKTVYFLGNEHKVSKMAWDFQQAKIDELQDQIAELKSKHESVRALCRMRAAVVTAEKWISLRPHIKNAIKHLDHKEKALGGGNS